MAALVMGASAWFALFNIGNAEALAPQWGQDLAFFHQWIHSAANGGPWGSPLILEPQGFFQQVHTHLILPFVVALYWFFPHQNLLLALHSFFVCLCLWPTYRLAEQIAGGRYALLCVLALLAFGPFQAVATADFRPLSLFLPGLIGVWASARKGSLFGMLGWASISLMGRQEAAYLLVSSGLAMLIFPWGNAKRQHGLALVGFGVLAWCLFVASKPTMFFHVNPIDPQPWPTSVELWERRLDFGVTLFQSGWGIFLFSPPSLLAAGPVLWGMLSGHREWHLLMGPGVHHHIFWLPFVVVGGLSVAHRIPKSMGPVLLLVASTFSFPWIQRQQGDLNLLSLVEQVPATAKVGADYDTIHSLSGRPVLWNIDHFYMPDQPWHWTDDWPLTVEDVDWILMPAGHPVSAHVDHWSIVSIASEHVLIRRP